MRHQDSGPGSQTEILLDALRSRRLPAFRLRRAYEHQTSDDTVDEALAVNEWTLTADGKPFG